MALCNLQVALRNFEITHAQFANSRPKADPDPNLTKLRSATCKLCSSTKCAQHHYHDKVNVAVHVMNVDHRQAAVTFRPIQLIRAVSQLVGYYLSTPTFIKSWIPISRRPEGGGTCVQPMLKAVFHSFFCDIHTTRSGLSEI